jgi:hypothetical protein
MEPERLRVDRAVLDFVNGNVFDPADFAIRSDGVCRLNPEMARMVVAKVLRRKSSMPTGRSRRKEAVIQIAVTRSELEMSVVSM